jgi:hypothetical protein
MAEINTTPYRLTIHPNRDIHAAPLKLATFIIDKWMPNNAGGVHVLLGQRLAGSLRQFFEKATERQKNYEIGIAFRGSEPQIIDLQALAEAERNKR